MKLVIVGGVAAGMSAAARARRLCEDAEIIVFERGAHVSFANCGLPYHIGGEIKDRDELLLHTPGSLKSLLNIDVRVSSEVISVDRANKSVRVRPASGAEYDERYDKLLLAPGAAPFKPALPGINDPGVFTLRNIEDMDKIIAAAAGARSAVVVGGGYIGVEMAENFAQKGLLVRLVQSHDQTLNLFDREMTAALEEHMEDNGVELLLGDSPNSFSSVNGKVIVTTNNGFTMEADLAVVAIGVRPETRLAMNAGLIIGASGGIKVDAGMRTSDPDIYAAGDAVEVLNAVTGAPSCIPLAGPANRQGRIAADNIFGRTQSKYSSSLGTAIVKVFGMTAASAGLSEKALKKAGTAYEKIYLCPNHHASYYPGAEPLLMKLMFTRPEGKILGFQITGFSGVDKQADVLATAMRAGMTVYDLQSLELAYAPPYGSAKAPVNMAGFIASNLLNGDTDCWQPEDYPSKTDGGIIIDVRPPDAHAASPIPGSINIPMSKLRQSLDKIPRDKNIFLHCRVGFTSYLAYRVLRQKGYGEKAALKTLSGGATVFFRWHRDLLKKKAAPKPQRPAMPVPAAPGAVSSSASAAAVRVDACGMQCPGPIMKVKDTLASQSPGTLVSVTASDPGFKKDIAAWCESNGHELVSVSVSGAKTEALIKKGGAPSAPAACSASGPAPAKSVSKTIVVFSGDLDKVLAAFVIANGVLAMGGKVTLFFTFWGLNALRKDAPQAPGKGILDKMFGMMLPKGPANLALSKMDMCGMGTSMMKYVMKSKNVATLQEMMDSAVKAGAKLIACSMAMDVMGLKKEELIDGVETGGVATFLQDSSESGDTLFI